MWSTSGAAGSVGPKRRRWWTPALTSRSPSSSTFGTTRPSIAALKKDMLSLEHRSSGKCWRMLMGPHLRPVLNKTSSQSAFFRPVHWLQFLKRCLRVCRMSRLWQPGTSCYDEEIHSEGQAQIAIRHR